jgi:ankyrin repeat protein
MVGLDVGSTRRPCERREAARGFWCECDSAKSGLCLAADFDATSTNEDNYYWRLPQDGFTALAHAAEEGHIDVVTVLLTAGVDVHVPDKVN